VAPSAPETVIREPQSQADLAALHMLLMVMGKEMALAPVNAEKVAQQIVTAASNPSDYTILLAISEGRLVGSLCFRRSDYWYSDAEFLFDLWFFVLPHFRSTDAGAKLLEEARAIAELLELPLLITRQKPPRRRNEDATGKDRVVGSMLRFSPHGSVLAFNVTEPEPDVLRK
jgi:GNAT superfamily N-acetyltransferase